MASDEESDTIDDEVLDKGDSDMELDDDGLEETPADADEDEPEADYVDVGQEGATEYTSEIMIVPTDQRVTSHWLSKFEVAEIINIRTSQIARYNNCLADTAGLTTASDQAKYELKMRLTPLVLRRNVGIRFNQETGKYHMYAELWKPSEMTLPLAF